MKCEKCGHDTESLAVLADRKGCFIQYIGKPSDWKIWIWGDRKPVKEQFTSDTYPEAEAQARAYLNGLPDKGEAK